MIASKTTLERLRFAALTAGCASLFWQWDLAAADVLFGLGILLSLALWERGEPLFDLAWPQPLLFLFLSISAVVTTLQQRESGHFFLITAYLAVVALALASALRRDPRRIRTVETALIIAGVLAAAMVTAGASAIQLHLSLLEIFAYDSLRGMGLFKDPNVAGAFIACTYPLAAARCLRLVRWRTTFLLIATAVFTSGVLYSYSRWALFLLVLAIVGTMVVLAVSRDRRPLLALVATVVVAGVVATQLLPSFRYQAKQGYDETGRLAAWRLALDLMVDRPLGVGAGSFETHAVERYGPASGWTSIHGPGPAPTPGPARSATQGPPNLARNGAFDGSISWPALPYAAVVDDPTSPTGHALRKNTTEKYQDPGTYIPIEAGQMYSFAAAIKTDGTPALLIIHWRDANDFTIDQAHTEPVTAPTWTESQLSAQIAPAEARAAVVLLSNLEAGTQYFTAIRVVVGPVAPAWSADLQHVDRKEAIDAETPVPTSTHNTFLRLVAENGVLGFTTMCMYWIVLAWSLLKMGRRSYPWSVAFVLVIMAGMTIDSFHWRQLWVYTAVAAAQFVPSPSRKRLEPLGEGIPAGAAI
jgi:O-antigen ligase